MTAPTFGRVAGTRDFHGRDVEDLTAVRARVAAAFASFGYQPVELPIFESAGLFLERSGEEIRRRMYVFDDPGGRELCLRPELTIPTARFYLREASQRGREARLSYAGPVFRYENPGEARFRQFQQAGVEYYGCADAEAADAEAVGLAARCLADVGLGDLALRLGDLDLVRALIGQLPVGERWRARLGRHLWRLSTFRALLHRDHEAAEAASAASGGRDPRAFLEAIAQLGPEPSRAMVGELLALADIRHVGERSMEEIVERLLARGVGGAGGQLSTEIVDLVERFLALKGPPDECAARVEAFAREAGVELGAPLDRLRRRLGLMQAFGVRTERATLDLGFRRGIEYYTGFIFEFHDEALGSSQVCGGGRYDRLLRLMGAAEDVPAVGFAIGLDRVLLATQRRRAAAEERAAPPVDVIVVGAGKVPLEACVRVAGAFRAAGFRVRQELSGRRPRAALDQALRDGVPYVSFVGEEELQQGAVRVKDLARREEALVPLDGIAAFVAAARRSRGEAAS